MTELANYKRIILCCDGTWQSSNAGDNSVPSNVAKLARAIAPQGLDDKGKIVPQIVLYTAGLGSGDLPGQRAIAGGLGWGLDGDVTQVYDFVANNFEKGDELLFFGFSRGAFTVRSAAGLISSIGVLSTTNMSQFHAMWLSYRTRDSNKPFEDSEWYRANKEKLKLEKAPIKVVGVWETVGALGVPQWPAVGWLKSIGVPVNKGYDFHDTSLSENFEFAFQALALDEKRLTFPPSVWHKTTPNQHLEQVWFPGVHTNLGGQAETPLELTDRGEIAANTLAWMVDNISGMLTFEDSTIDLFVQEHRKALEDNQIPHGWGCGRIVDNFSGWQGKIFQLLGQQTRTPGGHGPAPNATNEFMHPMVWIRQSKVPSWKPHALEGYKIQESDQNASQRREWVKAGSKASFALPEYVMSKDKILRVRSPAPDGGWTFATRKSLSITLCPPEIWRTLEMSEPQEKARV